MAIKTALSDQEYKQSFEKELAGSVGRAHWVSAPDEHQGHDGETLATRNHDVITKWAQTRKAQPATIAGTEHEGRPGVLRFDFPGGASQGRLQQIEWDAWFETFDARDLVMIYQENLSTGQQSNFFRMISPHREDG